MFIRYLFMSISYTIIQGKEGVGGGVQKGISPANIALPFGPIEVRNCLIFH